MTVEAVMLIPVVLLVLLILLFLHAHVHNRSVLTSNACTQAVCGREQPCDTLFLSRSAEISETEDTQRRQTVYSLETAVPATGKLFSDDGTFSYERLDPVTMIRRLRTLGAAPK